MPADLVGNLPCHNPNCKSFGKPHPNCQCYDDIQGGQRESMEGDGYAFPGTTAGKKRTGLRGGNWQEAKRRGRGTTYMAEGGSVCAEHMPHMPTCEHFKSGGPVQAPMNTYT